MILLIEPIGDGQFHCGLAYSNTIDITDIYLQNFVLTGLGFIPIDDVDRGVFIAARLRDRADDWGYTELSEMVVGIFTAAAADRIRGLEHRACTGPFWDCDGLSVAIFQISGFHRFPPRPMSWGTCSDVNTPALPAAQTMLKTGPLTSRDSFRASGLTGGRAVCFSDQSGGSLGGPFYDFMGYCGQDGNYDPDKWISVRGWNETLRNVLATGAPGSSAPQFSKITRPLSMRISSDQQLIVHAVHDHTGAYWITKVAPVTPDPENPILTRITGLSCAAKMT